jgi:NAD-dependent deacetylase
LAFISTAMAQALDVMRAAQRMVFFTGAGISTESGLPDYRGPDGVWTTGKIPSIGELPKTEEARLESWQQRRNMYPFMQSREPNTGHKAISQLVTQGRALAVITQNIDGLHQKSGVPEDRVIELHGSSRKLRCISSGHITDADVIQDQLEKGEPDPRCPQCGSILRSDTVLFGESLPKDVLKIAAQVSAATDVMVVVGSSLVVYPAAQFPQIARQRGASLIIIDRAETALDDLANIIVRGEAGEVLADLTQGVLEEK